MSDLSARSAPSPPDSFSRAAGVGGLAFAIIVISHNILRGQPLPGNSAADVVFAFYQAKRSILLLSQTAYIVALPALLIYAVGLMRRYSGNAAAEPWARVGRTSAYLVAVSFGSLMAADMAATLLAAQPGADPASVHAVFALRGGTFIVNSAILAVTLGAFAWAARLAAAEPVWLTAVGMVGAILLWVGALPAVLALEGSPVGLLGLGGFIIWLLWVLVTSSRMLRQA